MAALMRAKGITVEAAAFEYPINYDVPEAKRMKLSDGMGVDAAIEYPNTDGQYGISNEEEYTKYYEQYVGLSASDATEQNPKEASTEESKTAVLAWIAHIDDDTGATYYYNEASGESTWTKPEEASDEAE
jgi:hypothetical protein